VAAFTELKVWQLSMTLAENIYALTAGFPIDERYGITAQMRRASVSIPSNIAEGYGREQRGHLINFLRIAMGSCRELETQIKLSTRLKFCSATEALTASTQCDDVGKMLRGLLRSVEADAA
jgi:four helix bundle protein